jgi:TAP-like protein
MESTAAATPYAGPTIIDMWLSAAEGDASGLWSGSFIGDLFFSKLFVWGQYAAFGRADAQAVRDYFAAAGQDDGTNLGHTVTTYIWGGGRMVDAWPAAPDEKEYSQVRTSNVETLLIGGELDFSTPPQVATKELLPYLPNGQEVVLPRMAHTGTFFAVQPEASSQLINTYFDTGTVDDTLYQPQTIDFTPANSFGTIAKLFLGVALALAALTVLSLLGMAWRVHKRGGFGTKSRAVLRSLYTIVLGIGGWLLGTLIVLATMPSVPIDSDPVVALSVGVPVGLGVYLAWVHRDWSAQRKGVGLAAAIAAAPAGAWLGFHATTGLIALVTTILAAVAGANLVLILLDMARANSADDRISADAAPDTRSASVKSKTPTGAAMR